MSPLPVGAPPLRGGGLTLLPAMVASICVPLLARAQQRDATELLKTDSRSPYVHRITLYDHDGKAIRPDDAPALPYSPRATCGKCHPYAEICRGWHFNANDPNAFAGRPGEPWFLVDAQAGTAVPISARGWPGTVTPADAGLSDWDMVKRFGRHTPGGGFGEPRADTGGAAASTPLPSRSPRATRCGEEGLGEGQSSRPRWSVSGPLEIDCMICHSADQQHDAAEAARQIEKENFRWAATAALGLGVVRGEARKAPDDWDPYTPPDPDFPERAGPMLIYDKTRFDPDDRVLFQITRRVPNERCYFCHTTRVVGDGAPEPWHTDQDVHLAAGLLCVDCHRHGIDHAMTRGYEGESERPARVSRTCRGCHLGNESSAEITTVLGGHLRAPHPDHDGLPPLHLEELTCTVCHSGPWPRESTQRIQTAKAHQLGLPARERPTDAAPALVGPLFARHDEEEPITPSWRLDSGDAFHEAHRWPLAHDVRPAAQSLGARGCEDCHSPAGPVFFGRVSLAGEGRMHELHGYDPVLARVWALSFKARPAFKWFGFVCAALVLLVILRESLASLPTYGAAATLLRNGREAPPPPTPLPLNSAHKAPLGLLLAGTAIGAVTGFGGAWLGDEVEGWTLLVHMLGAPLLIVGLTGVALLWPAAYAPPTVSPWRRWALRAVIGAGFVVMVTMLAAMLPCFGYAEQETLTEIHAVAAYVLLAALAAWAVTSRFRPAR
ncbi:MAG: hypothetical protein AB1601_14975 [Planctomycetota bacterium]